MELEYNNDAPSGAEEMLSAIRDREKTYKEEDLSSDLNWLEASGKIYQMNNDGEKFQGDPKALAKYGIDQMSEFNYNVSLGTIPDVMKVEKADHDTQVAFAYMMDTYDKKDITLDGVGRAFKEAAIDPLNWVGIGTLGAGLFAKKGAEQVAKEGFKNRLHGAIRSYLTSGLAVGATEGALYTAGDEVARESVYQDADLMDGYSAGNIAASGAVGALAGAGLVKGIEVAGKGIGKGIDYVRKQGEEAMAQVAGGGTPDMMKLYHGTNAEFEKFDRVGNRITSIGYGHYFSPDKDVAIQYGKNIKEIGIPKSMVLDLDNPTPDQKKLIIEKLDKVVPDEIKAGFGEVKRIDITDMNDKDSLALYKQKKADTSHLYHDRAKASVVEEGDKTYIQWMEAGLESATNANIKNLIQEYGQNIPKDIGYKAAKSGNEVAVYDTDLVNSSIIKGEK